MCSGSSASAEVHDRKINYQTQVLFTANDIDRVVAQMCYIQLSLLGCAGWVAVANTISDPVTGDPLMPDEKPGQEFWYTPFYFREEWCRRRQLKVFREQFGALIMPLEKPKVEKRTFYFDFEKGEYKMSEQLKHELEADIDRLETETVAYGKIIGKQEKELPEGKLEDESGNESSAEVAKDENTKSIKQKAKEKLEAEKKKATQKYFADPVIAYLLKRCEGDQGLAEDVMQEGKTWDKCYKYIVDQAIKVPRSGIAAAVEDPVVYEWAEDYYHKEEKPEPAQKESDKKTSEKKAKSAKKVIQKEEKCSKDKENVQSTSENGQKTEKAEKKEKPKKKETAKKPDKPSMDGQMSLFDLL